MPIARSPDISRVYSVCYPLLFCGTRQPGAGSRWVCLAWAQDVRGGRGPPLPRVAALHRQPALLPFPHYLLQIRVSSRHVEPRAHPFLHPSESGSGHPRIPRAPSARPYRLLPGTLRQTRPAGRAPGCWPELGATGPQLRSHFLGRDAEGQREPLLEGARRPGAARAVGLLTLPLKQPSPPVLPPAARRRGTEARPPPYPARGPRGSPSSCGARPAARRAGGAGVREESAGCGRAGRGGASISAEDRVIGSGDNESQGSGARTLPSPCTRSRDGFRGERGPLRLPQPLHNPARAEEGQPGPGRSRPLCNQCSPDLIPRRTHPTGSRGPGRADSRRHGGPGPGASGRLPRRSNVAGRREAGGPGASVGRVRSSSARREGAGRCKSSPGARRERAERDSATARPRARNGGTKMRKRQRNSDPD